MNYSWCHEFSKVGTFSGSPDRNSDISRNLQTETVNQYWTDQAVILIAVDGLLCRNKMFLTSVAAAVRIGTMSIV